MTFRLRPDAKSPERLMASVSLVAETPVKEIKVYVDGRLARAEPTSTNQGEFTFTLDHPGAGRWVSATAVDANNLVSQPVSIRLPGEARPRGDLHTVFIGIDKYRDPQITTLRQAKYDANNLANTIKAIKARSFTLGSTELLLDEAASRESILNRIKSAAERTTENDRLLIFFSGHGEEGAAVGGANSSLYLIANDSMVSDLKNTAVAWTDITKGLSAARGTVVIILDACHAGFADKPHGFSNDGAAATLLANNPVVVSSSPHRKQTA